VSNEINLIMISGKKTATIPINGIILNRNIKNIESMKKVGFLGLMLVAFQSMVFAQADYGLSIGGGTWWSKCNNPVVNGKQVSSIALSPNFNLGVYYKQHLQSRFTIETRLNYRLLLSNYSYKSSYPPSQTYIPDEKYYYLLWDEIGDPGEVLMVNGEKVYTSRGVGEEASTINYHNVEVPFQIGYSFSKFNPYAGIRYSLKMFNLSETEVTADDGKYITEWGRSETTGINNLRSCFGIIGGINYKISDKFNIGINYYHAFTKDYDYTGYLIESATSEIASKDNYFWKSRSVEVSLSYSFRRKQKE
jgi:opacity protein-like surface antigen